MYNTQPKFTVGVSLSQLALIIAPHRYGGNSADGPMESRLAPNHLLLAASTNSGAGRGSKPRVSTTRIPQALSGGGEPKGLVSALQAPLGPASPRGFSRRPAPSVSLRLVISEGSLTPPESATPAGAAVAVPGGAKGKTRKGKEKRRGD